MEEKRHRQLRHVGSHRTGGVRDRHAVEERPREPPLHLSPAVRHQPEAGRGLGKRGVEARAVPRRHQGIGRGADRGESAQAGGPGEHVTGAGGSERDPGELPLEVADLPELASKRLA